MAALATQAVSGKSVLGNQRYHWGTCTGESSAGHVATGLSVLNAAWTEAIDTTVTAKTILNSSAGTEGDSMGNLYGTFSDGKLFRWHALGR